MLAGRGLVALDLEQHQTLGKLGANDCQQISKRRGNFSLGIPAER